MLKMKMGPRATWRDATQKHMALGPKRAGLTLHRGFDGRGRGARRAGGGLRQHAVARLRRRPGWQSSARCPNYQFRAPRALAA